MAQRRRPVAGRDCPLTPSLSPKGSRDILSDEVRAKAAIPSGGEGARNTSPLDFHQPSVNAFTGPTARQRRDPQRQGRRRGVTAVEFAIVAPVILLLFFGAIEITRLNFLRHTAANAAYEGARSAIVPGGTASDADTSALRLLTAVQANQGADIEVVESLDRVAVTVVIPVDMNSWGLTRFTSGYNIVQSCTLSRETSR